MISSLLNAFLSPTKPQAHNTTIDDEHHRNLSANGYWRTLPNSARRWHSDSPAPLDMRQARSIVPEPIVEYYEYPYAEQIGDEDTYERGGKVPSHTRKRLHHNPRYSAAWKEKGKDKITQRNEEVINPITPSAPRFNSSSSSSSPIDDSDSDDATQLISKPKGNAGRPNSGGYSLEQELRWKGKTYKRFKAKVKSLVSEVLDTSKPYSSQADGLIQYVCESVAHEFPKLRLYEENWPVKDLIRLELRYAQTRTRDKLTKQQARAFREASGIMGTAQQT